MMPPIRETWHVTGMVAGLLTILARSFAEIIGLPLAPVSLFCFLWMGLLLFVLVACYPRPFLYSSAGSLIPASIWFYRHQESLWQVIAQVNHFWQWIAAYFGGSGIVEPHFAKLFLYSVSLLVAALALIELLRRRSAVLLAFGGVGALAWQWFVYTPKAAVNLVPYWFLLATLWSVLYYKSLKEKWQEMVEFPADWTPKILPVLALGLVIILIMPVKFRPLEWTWLSEKVMDLFPFVEDWRGGELEETEFSLSGLWWGDESKTLGGPIQNSDRVYFYVRGGEGLYLRGAVYDRYDGKRWYKEETWRKISTKENIVSHNNKGEYRRVVVNIRPAFRFKTVFAPWQPWRIETDQAEILVNRDLALAFQKSSRQPYKIEALIPAGLPADDRAKAEAQPAIYRTTPALNPRVVSLAQEVTANAGSPLAKAEALEAYLRGFPYDLQVPAPEPGQDFVDFFLFTARKGYCTYYATAMAVMLRTLDIPARYVEGFVLPEKIEGETAVTGRRAHAWVEAYFSGIGWVPFEPTPAFPIPNRDSPKDGFGLSPDSAFPVANPLPVNAAPRRREREWDEGDAATSSPYAKKQEVPLWVYGLTLAGIGIGILYCFWRQRQKLPKWYDPRDPRARIVYAYQRIVTVFAKSYIPRTPDQSPAEYAEALAGSLPAEIREAFLEATRIAEKACFGPQTEEEDAARISTLCGRMQNFRRGKK